MKKLVLGPFIQDKFSSDSVLWTKSPNCWVLSRCFLYIFRPEVVWLPVLQLSKAEDAYALARSDVWKPVSKSFPRFFRREGGKQKDRQYKFHIFNTSVDTLLYKCKHSYTTSVNVLYKHTDIYHRKRDTKPYNVKTKTMPLSHFIDHVVMCP